jgi:signal transduction histidine kinase
MDQQASNPLTRIVTSGRRMARMIEQVMDFTRIRRGAGIQPTVERCCLEEICRQMMDELGHANPDWKLAPTERAQCRDGSAARNRPPARGRSVIPALALEDIREPRTGIARA